MYHFAMTFFDSFSIIIHDAFSGVRWERNFEITRPATENTFSEGAEVAGIHRNLRAILAIVGT